MGTLVTFDEFTASGRPQGGTIRELVLDKVTNVVTKKRPLMSVLGMGGRVSSTFVESLEDTLGSRGDNAHIEGIAYTAQDSTQPTRIFTHVQTFYKSGQISSTQRNVGHAGMRDPYAYQVNKKLQELLNDVEHALHRGSAATGATSAARRFDGLLNIPGTSTFTSCSGTTLTEGVFIDLLQAWFDNSYDMDISHCFVNSWLKRTISEYSTKNTFNVEADRRYQVLQVERHSSDFGDVLIVPTVDQLAGSSRTGDTNSLIFADVSKLSLGWLQPVKVEPLARDGLRDRFQISAEVTLVYDTAKAVGGANQLTPYINA
jgi:hypothetical protein